MNRANFEMGFKKSFRLWSQRLNVIASLIVVYVLASPDILLQTLNQMPSEIRGIFPPAAGIALFALVSFARLYKQEKLNGAKHDGTNASGSPTGTAGTDAS